MSINLLSCYRKRRSILQRPISHRCFIFSLFSAVLIRLTLFRSTLQDRLLKETSSKIDIATTSGYTVESNRSQVEVKNATTSTQQPGILLKEISNETNDATTSGYTIESNRSQVEVKNATTSGYNKINWSQMGAFHLIHVGKTGGATINANIRSLCNLKRPDARREECLTTIEGRTDEMVISNRTTGYLHARLNRISKRDSMNEASALIWSIRDPFDRITSAFYMQHPENEKKRNCETLRVRGKLDESLTFIFSFYCLCFTHVEEFISAIHQPSNKTVPANARTNATVDCPELARREANPHGNNTIMSHIGMNYGYLYSKSVALYPGKNIISLRAEHLWDDLQQLEHLLGGNAAIRNDTQTTVTHGSESFRLKRKLTPSLVQILCCAIKPDVQVYIELLQRAINIEDWQKQESIEALSKRCNLKLCNSEKIKVGSTE